MYTRDQFGTEVTRADVVVVGSGSGGLSAAVSAARAGASVLLVEKNGYLGGMCASGLPYLGYLDEKKRLCVGGFATEFVDRLTEAGASLGVRYCPKHLSVVVTKPDEVRNVAAEICAESGVKVVLHSYLVEAKTEGRKVRSLVFDCAGTRFEVSGKIYIDATGDGVLGALAGAEFDKGTAGVDLQPASVILTIGGVDKERFLKWVGEHPEELPPYTVEYLRKRPDYTFVTLGNLWKKTNPDGQWPFSGIWAMIMMNRLNDTEVALNGPRVPATDSTDPFSVTYAEIEGQRQALEAVPFLRRHVGGFENDFLSHINDSIGVRESRRIRGVKTLSIDEVTAGRSGDDTIALGSYPVDVHSSSDNTSYMRPVREPYGIPYLCTVSRSVDNLMMSGRDISVDRLAFGSTRVMGTCLAVGEGVGVGAALAAKKEILPKDVDVREIREILLSRGAVLKVEE